MPKYDDASWHYGGDFPKELPPENGATHIGFFLTWCIDNGLVSDFQLEESGEDVQRVKGRQITGRDFLLQNCDEKFTDEDLNDLGNSFAQDYYQEEGTFAEQHADYLSDYQTAFEILNQELDTKLESIYHIEDSVEVYEGIKIILDERFKQWKAFAGIA